jgi:hypothetical protein
MALFRKLVWALPWLPTGPYTSVQTSYLWSCLLQTMSSLCDRLKSCITAAPYLGLIRPLPVSGPVWPLDAHRQSVRQAVVCLQGQPWFG